MAKFATASDALTAALAIVDARLTDINTDEQLELYIQLIDRRAKTQQAIAASGGGGGGGGDASAANQTVVQAIAGANASKAISVQGITDGKTIPISGSISNSSFGISGTLPAFAVTPTFDIGTAPDLTITNTTFAATQSGTWNLTNISGTISLPTGAATSANQTTGNSSLSSIDGKLPSTLGSKTAANSLSATASTDLITSTQLTGTGSTTAIATAGYKLVGVTAKVASIGTNVVVRVEVSNVGGTNAADWDNASLDNADTTITANGTKAFKLDCAFAYVRFTWVSTSGGTPTIDVITRLAS